MSKKKNKTGKSAKGKEVFEEKIVKPWEETAEGEKAIEEFVSTLHAEGNNGQEKVDPVVDAIHIAETEFLEVKGSDEALTKMEKARAIVPSMSPHKKKRLFGDPNK